MMIYEEEIDVIYYINIKKLLTALLSGCQPDFVDSITVTETKKKT